MATASEPYAPSDFTDERGRIVPAGWTATQVASVRRTGVISALASLLLPVAGVVNAYLSPRAPSQLISPEAGILLGVSTLLCALHVLNAVRLMHGHRADGWDYAVHIATPLGLPVFAFEYGPANPHLIVPLAIAGLWFLLWVGPLHRMQRTSWLSQDFSRLPPSEQDHLRRGFASVLHLLRCEADLHPEGRGQPREFTARRGVERRGRRAETARRSGRQPALHGDRLTAPRQETHG